MTISGTAPSRKQRFGAALKLAGITQNEWCDNRGVSRQHLQRVLSGERDAGSDLDAAIDATIDKYLGAVAPAPAQ